MGDNKKDLNTVSEISPSDFEEVIKDEKVQRSFIDIILDRVLNEGKFCAMYSDLCKKIIEYEKQNKDQIRKVVIEKYNQIEMENYNRLNAKEKDEFDTKHNIKATFRTFLLSACQKELEQIKFVNFNKVPKDLKPEDKTDFEEQQFKERKRIFGLFKFLGELFKQSILSEKIVHTILISLICDPSEIKLECFCILLSIVGKHLSQNEESYSYSQTMQQLEELPLETLSQRIRFIIQNVIDLKNNNWFSKTDDSAKTTVNSNDKEFVECIFNSSNSPLPSSPSPSPILLSSPSHVNTPDRCTNQSIVCIPREQLDQLVNENKNLTQQLEKLNKKSVSITTLQQMKEEFNIKIESINNNIAFLNNENQNKTSTTDLLFNRVIILQNESTDIKDRIKKLNQNNKDLPELTSSLGDRLSTLEEKFAKLERKAEKMENDKKEYTKIIYDKLKSQNKEDTYGIAISRACIAIEYYLENILLVNINKYKEVYKWGKFKYTFDKNDDAKKVAMKDRINVEQLRELKNHCKENQHCSDDMNEILSTLEKYKNVLPLNYQHQINLIIPLIREDMKKN
ncbi:hypothetical protein DICPUDRAFT_80871 [Dictyostelium purpureum]|uniref:MIF4G domain-containing protein n=1 Tax=Dictyostelium purpureum TaxID=5786 RepID=F0ZRT0_DICPU|nr:uncharacterized protein DICPUDRAFT_80871 [Dictyostelium purpureum]EGC33339.1 hypothetical protein DICPUDRAFT_80871 [Dictyostelium purpureum]|eukprot:XP_003290124.1 hypothetical protein DICPUDRAFT_80871 [Dictyostelium purpureum]